MLSRDVSGIGDGLTMQQGFQNNTVQPRVKLFKNDTRIILGKDRW